MPVDKSNVENIHALTPMQEGLLFHALMEPRSTAYFEQLCWRVRGQLDLPLFEAAWNDVIRRHAPLRSLFVHEGADRPLQVVLREHPLKIASVDVRGSDAEARAAVFRAADRARAFTPAKEPPLRVTVLQLAGDRYEIVWSHHHLMLDGWSVGIVLSELAEVCRARRAGTRPALPSVTPAARYVKWLDTRDREGSAGFWERLLAGVTGRTTIPHTRTSLESAAAPRGVVGFDLDRETTAALNGVAARRGVTGPLVMQAAWAVLLARHNDTTEIVFGSVVSGRTPDLPGIERMVGNFINTIPVRVEVRPDATFAELLAAMHRDAAAAEPHQHTALSRVHGVSRMKHDLFGTLVSFANYPVAQQDPATGALGFVVEEVSYTEQTHYDVDVQCIPGDSLRVRITYKSEAYERAQMEALAGHFRAVVTALVGDADATLGSVDLLAPAERARLLGDVPAAGPALRETGGLVDAFERQVSADPNRLAVVAADGRLTYGEVRERARHLASRLRAAVELQPDDRIGLLLDRGVALPVGILAALEAGGCYVPLEPSLPPDRLRYILSNAGCRVVVAGARTIEVARACGDIPLVDVDGLAPAAAAESRPRANGSNAAYVIYTSGSTGQPKGVMIEQHSVLNLVDGLRARVFDRYAGPLRVALVASYGFDASVQQIFSTLLLGHTLVIVDDGTKRDGAAMNRFLVEHDLDVFDGTPTLLQIMANAEGFGALRQRARHALIGGEALPAALMRRVVGAGDGIVVSNVYGPTECCVDATEHLIDRAPDAAAATVSIGTPLPNVHVLILDRTGHLAPIGARGELYIAGAGVGRGYLQDDAANEAKFVTSPLMPGVRLYRTADAARWLPDGTLECLGRLDDQVKVRGVRIELGEIEHQLVRHPSVAQAAAVVLRGPQGEDELHASLVLVAPVQVDALRAHLGQTLPEALIPARFFQTTAFPRTSSGKLDRRMLVERGLGEPLHIGSDYVEPVSEVEKQIVDAWQTVLDQPRVGIDDNYFSLGGDSIKAIQLVSRLLRHNLRVELRDVFRYPTIRRLAPHVVATDSPSTARARSDITVAPLLPAQARFFADHTVEPGRFHHAVLLDATSRLDPTAVARAFATLRDRHESLRVTFRSGGASGPQEQAAAAPGGPPPDVAVFDLRDRDDAWATLQAHADTLQAGVDLSTGPLFRLAIFREEAGDRLLIVVHHLAIDVVSWRVLIEELEVLWRAADSTHDELPPLTDSVLHCAVEIRRPADEAEVTSAREYWDAIDARVLRQIDAATADRSARYRDQVRTQVTLPPEETACLLTRVNQAYNTTTEDILLAALARALHAQMGHVETPITLEHHGRDAIAGVDASRTIGWFTSLFPFVLELDPARDLAFHIKATKEALRAVPQRGIRYGLLRYCGDRAAPGSRPPRPAISFNYLGQIDAGAAGAMFRVVPEPIAGWVNPDAACLAEIEISAAVSGGVLGLTLAYNHLRFAADRMQALLACWRTELGAAVEHCRTRTVTEVTPADLTYAGLSVDELEDMFS